MEEPRPEQFGLSEDDLNEQEKNNNKWELIVGKVLLSIGAVLGIIWAYINIKVNIFLRIVYALMLGAVIGFAAGFAAYGIIIILTMIFQNIFSSKHRKLGRYKKAKEAYDFWVIRTRKEHWLLLSGKRFEYELAILYSKSGYEIELPKHGPDRGVDIILKKDNKTIIVQCKAHQKPIGPHIVRDLYGTMINFKADEAILASISGFSQGVKEYVRDKAISLVGLEDILRMQSKVK